MTTEDPQQDGDGDRNPDRSQLPNTVSEILADVDPTTPTSGTESEMYSPGFASPGFEGPGISGNVQLGNSELGQRLRDEQTHTHPDGHPHTHPDGTDSPGAPVPPDARGEEPRD